MAIVVLRTPPVVVVVVVGLLLGACGGGASPDLDSDAHPLLDGIPWTEPATGDVRDLGWGDMESDGDLDLALVEHGGALRIYENQDGELVPYAEAVAEEVDSWSGPESVAWMDVHPPEGDVPDDFRLELVVGGDRAPLAVYELGEGGGLVVTQTVEGLTDVNALASGDMDGDGDLDLAVARDGWPNAVLRNDGGILLADEGWQETPEDSAMQEV